MKRYYFDNNASTKVPEEVIDAMLPYFHTYYAIPSSQFSHQDGIMVSEAIENARGNIAEHFNADHDEIIFTSGETESNNLAIKGFLLENSKGGEHIITCKTEHRSVLNIFRSLEKDYKITYIDVDETGLIDLEQLRSSITNDTILVSIQTANHEVGTVQDIKKISAGLSEKNIVLHTNMTYAVLSMPFNLKELNIGLASFSGDKIHGPKGIGVIFKKKDIKLKRLFEGNFNEYYIRPGIVNVPGIIGLSKAVDILKNNKDDFDNIRKLRDILIKGLLEIPDSVLNGHAEKRTANNVNITFYKAEGESVVLHLDMHGISVITGSACFSESLEPSYVMMAMGYSHERAHGSVRYTLSRYNTAEEIKYAISKTTDVVKRLREISPLK